MTDVQTRRTLTRGITCGLLLSGLQLNGGVLASPSLDELMYLSEFGSEGAVPGQFSDPISLAVDAQNRILVADRLNHRIQICTDVGECTAFGGLGTELGYFNGPEGVTVDSIDRIVVADTGNNRVQICSHDGQCEPLRDANGLPRLFDEPRDVAVDSQGRIVVTEPEKRSLHVCTNGGTCHSFDDLDGKPNINTPPQTVTVDAQDNYLILTLFDEVWSCNLETDCQRLFGSHGADPGQFASAGDLAVDSLGRIVIADQGNSRVQLCGVSGECSTFDVYRSSPQMFWRPSGIGLTDDGRVLLTERGGDHVQVYDLVTIEGPAIPVNAALNDAWYDPAAPGQGFFINVFDRAPQSMFVTWFTYDLARPMASAESELADAGHRWLTAQGIFHTYTATLDIFLTQGGIFLDPSFETATRPYGEMTVRFSDCGNGTIIFDIPSVDRRGEIPISRLAKDSEVFCEALLK